MDLFLEKKYGQYAEYVENQLRTQDLSDYEKVVLYSNVAVSQYGGYIFIPALFLYFDWLSFYRIGLVPKVFKIYSICSVDHASQCARFVGLTSDP
jgi:hypothetical protein